MKTTIPWILSFVALSTLAPVAQSQQIPADAKAQELFGMTAVELLQASGSP